MIALDNLEMHAVHACDHACRQCSHFSDYGFAGVVSLEDADEQMRRWSRRLDPRWFSILGGEPTLHPRLPEFVWLACRHWPRVRLITNGSFLHRHPALPAVLEEHNVLLELSVHHTAPHYTRRVVDIKQLLNDWLIERRFSVRIRESFTQWRRLFRGEGGELRPYADGDHQRSWNVCPSKWCPQIHDGKLYKCPPVAYLPMLDRKVGLGSDWEPYLAYEPLAPECSDDELREFVSRRAESVCGMCPAQPEFFELPEPWPVAHKR
jgi:hypothetical protein